LDTFCVLLQEELVALSAIYANDFVMGAAADSFSIFLGGSAAAPAATQQCYVELVRPGLDARST
jgi:hypothetical protein